MDKREAERREDEIMKELKASMNTIKSFLTEEEKKEYSKEYNKEYNEDNKEYIKEHKKQHYETNKEQIKDKQRGKITCKCGTVVLKRNLKRHERTKKHTDLMK
jgi:fibronectin type 3 domain-containing protein